MKTLHATIAILLAIAGAGQIQAAEVTITSPDKAQTRSDATILSRGLHWDDRQHEMRAVITFSNLDYASDIESQHDDTFAFDLPGIQFDPAQNLFYTVSKNGVRTPIAKYTQVLFARKIQLLPGATVFTEENQGNISVRLTKGAPSLAPHWKEIGPEM